MTTTDRLPTLDEAGRALLFSDARTANSFAPTPVTDEELREIWQLAKWAPTAANTQPLRVLYVRTGEGKARLVPLMAEGNRAKTQSAPAVAVLAIDTRFYDHMAELFPPRPQMADYFRDDEVAALGSRTFNGPLQAGYFILAVRALGLAAGPMAGFDGPAIDAEFFPDGRFTTALVVNIGHPGADPWFGRLPRLAEDDVLSWA